MKNYNKEYLFLFTDLIDSTTVANMGTDDNYTKYIGSYHWAISRAKNFIQSNYVFPQSHFRRIIQNIEISGDEVYSYSLIERDTSPQEKEDLVASSVSFIYMLQLYWLASPYNLERLRENKPIMKISAGLHLGKGFDIPTETSNTLVGLNINATKRIETKAKEGKQSNIYATSSVKTLFDGWKNSILKELPAKFRPPLSYTSFKNDQEINFKGLFSNIKVFELELSYNGYKKDFDALFDDMTFLTNRDEFQAEIASMIMSTNFLICRGNPFRYDDGRNAIPGYNYNDATEYIELWFEIYNNNNLDFITSNFMALNYSIISSALLRHPEITEELREKYLNICKEKYIVAKKQFFDVNDRSTNR